MGRLHPMGLSPPSCPASRVLTAQGCWHTQLGPRSLPGHREVLLGPQNQATNPLHHETPAAAEEGPEQDTASPLPWKWGGICFLSCWSQLCPIKPLTSSSVVGLQRVS